ncbi:partial Serine/threonine-protein kinase Pkn1, partial [Anaerolineae bacterium]
KGEDVAGGQSTAVFENWQWLKSTADWKERLERTGSYSPKDLENFQWLAGLNEEQVKEWLSKSFTGKSRERPSFWNDAQYNNPSQPVVGITWFEANAYCVWLSEMFQVSGFRLQVWRDGKLETRNMQSGTWRVRLPTEVEWESAARGIPSPVMTGEGSRVGARVYPWGNEWDAARANTIEGRVMRTSPVGAYQAAGGVGEFGAEDQSGNTWDWTSTLYRDYPYQDDDRENPEAEGERVVRGGSWFHPQFNARCACRRRFVPDSFLGNFGFRLSSPGSIPAS